jgi:hypothetical protein
MSEEVEADVSDVQWKEVRDRLKAAILAGTIPVESKEMRPKAVYQQFVNSENIDYTVNKTKEKFARMLRSLRSKHKNGDLAIEGQSKVVILWAKSAAKQILRKWFRDGTILTTFETKGEIDQIWKDHCKDHAAFKKMKNDGDFIRRIKSVRDDHLKKEERCQGDLQAYTIAKLNHPTPELNARGEPQWNGSEAQKKLKELVANDQHAGKKPKELWDANNDFQRYSLRSFRDHIYQEQRLIKMNNYVEQLKQAKMAELQY